MRNEHESEPAISDSFSEPHGIIVIDKPPGPTSFDCIRFLKRTCEIPSRWKTGHLGTLDPFASGVMVIALGKAVRYAEYSLKSRKKYRARMWLGDETDTLDPTGKVTESKPIPENWVDRLSDIEAHFTGKINQIPPAYSAKHVNGRRSYDAARKGEMLQLKPVEVEIFSLQFTNPSEYWVDFVTEVSSGTYIRSLARDIAYKLETVGHLIGLERIAHGPFNKEVAIPFSAFETGGGHVLEHHLRTVDQILYSLKPLTIKQGLINKIIHGQILEMDDFSCADTNQILQDETVKIINEIGEFVSLGRVKSVTESTIEVTPFKPWIERDENNS